MASKAIHYNVERIKPYSGNSFYWQYKDKPVLLLGGSVEDNLFQISGIESHLDLLRSVGGNYVRCTMSSRDEGNVWPFEKEHRTGLYDLNVFNEEYWRRFKEFLSLAFERDIIVQIELWDRFDFAREPWQRNPYNPKNNINYTAEESRLKEEINTHPGLRENAFFSTVPALENNAVVLKYQHLQIDRMLSISLRFGNILYCMDNETNESPEWGWYWSKYIRAKAAEAGIEVETTEMWDTHNVLDKQHITTLNHPEIYSFLDLSQNNHLPPSEHWDNLLQIHKKIIESGHARPMNSVKVYGANSGRYGSTRDGQERFWRNIFAGLASSRFHRPSSGLGLNGIAQSNIKSMRMLVEELDVFSCEPHNDLLENRSWNEAYCTANPSVEYAIFFPDGGDILLDISGASGKSIGVRWLDIRKSRWTSELIVHGLNERTDGYLRLTTPIEEGYWVAIVKVKSETNLV
jgi:hypothetical protein